MGSTIIITSFFSVYYKNDFINVLTEYDLHNISTPSLDETIRQIHHPHASRVRIFLSNNNLPNPSYVVVLIYYLPFYILTKLPNNSTASLLIST